MTAKIKTMIINVLKNSSLQSSLQKRLISTCYTSGFYSQSSLQTQALLQTLCKENNSDWQPIIKTPFAHPFAETTNLRKA